MKFTEEKLEQAVIELFEIAVRPYFVNKHIHKESQWS